MIIALIVILAAGFIFYTEVAAIVGTTIIFKKDVALRDQVNRNPSFDDGSGSLNQLINSAIQIEVIKKKYSVGRNELLGRQMYIGLGTDPQSAERAKDIFQNDVSAYRRVFQLPMMAQRFLYKSVFLADPKNQEPLKAAQMFIRKTITDPSRFLDEASKAKIKTGRAVVLPNGELLVQGEAPNRAARNSFRDIHDPSDSVSPTMMIQSLANSLKPGQIAPQPLSRKDDWIVVRRAEGTKNSGPAVFETAIFPKVNFEEWKKTLVDSTPVRVMKF